MIVSLFQKRAIQMPNAYQLKMDHFVFANLVTPETAFGVPAMLELAKYAQIVVKTPNVYQIVRLDYIFVLVFKVMLEMAKIAFFKVTSYLCLSFVSLKL